MKKRNPGRKKSTISLFDLANSFTQFSMGLNQDLSLIIFKGINGEARKKIFVDNGRSRIKVITPGFPK
ncbi:MAG: hypothetical protein ACOYXC_03220 [Candidatus Rifleibacteriota bacterium]